MTKQARKVRDGAWMSRTLGHTPRRRTGRLERASTAHSQTEPVVLCGAGAMLAQLPRENVCRRPL